MFIAPTARDLAMAKVILDTFEGASGLGSNLAKCQLVSICRAEDQVQTALSIFPCQRLEFPITYLGMPLSVYKLSLTSLQPISDNQTRWQTCYQLGKENFYTRVAS
jgi:hypothetical protein